MDENQYRQLKNRLERCISNLNSNRNFLKSLVGGRYDGEFPNQEEFSTHGKSLRIAYSTDKSREKFKSLPLITIWKDEEGINGDLRRDNDPKAVEKVENIIHAFSHEYLISTGTLLY